VPTKPWLTLHRPDPEREYLVVLTELPVKRARDLGAFLRYTWHIRGQLRRTPGLLGYSLRARLLTRQFWTLSVWEGDAALDQFIFAHSHAHVMMALQGKMGQTHFVQWSIRGAEFPPRWPAALARRGPA
jgi:hypothetical protein